MTIAPLLRKFAVTAHIICSAGWLGAVIAYLCLVIGALTNQKALTIRSAWIAMDMIGWYVIVPMAILSLITGLTMSLITPWGLFRHYWVLFKLLLTCIATFVLLLNMPNVSFLADQFVETNRVNVHGLQSQLVHSGGGLLVLIAVTILSVYKPKGLTRYGIRKKDN
jgi:hypothetical protein